MKTKMFTMTRTLRAGRTLLAGLLVASATLTASPEVAHAEKLPVSGPLAGAPAVRQLRLYRKLRLELAPVVSFTLLDEYRRQIFGGIRANFGVTDWLSIGAWGAVSTSLIGADMNTYLTKQIQDVNSSRDCNGDPTNLDCKLTAVNLGNDFKNQIASMDWVAAPQVTVFPFRGKLGLFNEVFVDADMYLFAGVGIVGLSERPTCDSCTKEDTFQAQSRLAVAPTFGLGLTFFTNRWTALGVEWRALPFKWNTGGFDVAGEGTGDDKDFPDGRITNADREFHFNQMLSVSFSFFLPQQHRISE